MLKTAQEALRNAHELAEQVNKLVLGTHDLDLQRLLKQVEADLMDLQHKLSIAVKLSEREKP
jgi:hypothetical protein